MNDLSPKARMSLPRQSMPAQPADERSHNFSEVNLGLSVLQAHQEALRCLECTHPRCTQGCPVGVKVKDFVALIAAGDLLAAAAKLREDNVLPAITGRVCPQEHQCEGACILGKRLAPLGIGYLERFVSDYEREHGVHTQAAKVPTTGKRVAIVGSGPAGLSAAGDLAQRGHAVTVFEALHEPGGVLIYGIPEFRLPKEIVRAEIENLRRLGVAFETNVVIGKTVTIDELLGTEGYQAVFIATGAGLPKFLGVAGEHLAGVYSANEFLTRINLMRADQFPDYDEPVFDCRRRTVAVVGGGNTAMDAVRTALRLGAARALLIYRRSEVEMPARREEIQHAREEGVEFLTETVPKAFVGNEQGLLRSIQCIRTEPGPPDRSGRRRVQPIADSEFEVPAEIAVMALGTGANPLIQASTPELATDARGYIAADPETLTTSRPHVFAGGDIVTGGATVISAMGAGRRAAAAIHAHLLMPDSKSDG